jgi:hypothetical protein
MCARCINRLGEGLGCSGGGHRRRRHAIGNDGRPAKSPGRPAMVGGCTIPLEVGQPSPTRQSSPIGQGRGSHPVRVLSAHPMIGKENHSVTPTRPSTGVLTPKKITIRCQLVVLSSSNDDDLPLVKHDTRVDLNSSGVRIRYTQEHALVSNSPPQSLSPYIVSGQRIRVGHNKVLIPNPEYKGKGRTALASLNQTPRLLRPPPKIHGPPRTMEFSDDEEEEEELSNELMALLKQKITALEEQVVELHLEVYDQQDDFGVLRKATTSKLKRFVKALSGLSLYKAPSPKGCLEKFGNNLKSLCLSCCNFFPFHSKIIKVTLYFYFIKLKVESKYLYLTWCAFEHQMKKILH